MEAAAAAPAVLAIAAGIATALEAAETKLAIAAVVPATLQVEGKTLAKAKATAETATLAAELEAVARMLTVAQGNSNGGNASS